MTDMPAPSATKGAEIGPRFVAKLIDWAIGIAMVIPVFILAVIFGAINDGLGFLVAVLGYLAAIGAIIYIFGWGMGETGQTPGKRMQGLQVVDHGSDPAVSCPRVVSCGAAGRLPEQGALWQSSQRSPQ